MRRGLMGADRRRQAASSVLGLLVGFGLFRSTAAFAYFAYTDSSDAHQAQASAGTIGAASGFSAGSVTASSAVLSWTAPSGYTPTNWTVTQTSPSGTVSGTCAGSEPASGCAVSSLSPSTSYSWTLTYFDGSWQSATTSGATTLTAAPAAPASVTLANGGGTGGAYIDAANASAIDVNVVLASSSASTDTVHLQASDGTHTVTAPTQNGISGGGTDRFTGLDLSGLYDGTVTFTSWVTNAGGTSSTTSSTNLKDTVAPTGLAVTSETEKGGSGAGTLAGTAGNVAASATTSADSPTVTIKIYNSSNTLVESDTTTRSGTTWSVSYGSVTRLAKRSTYTATVTQSDAAGNTATSAPYTFTT